MVMGHLKKRIMKKYLKILKISGIAIAIIIVGLCLGIGLLIFKSISEDGGKTLSGDPEKKVSVESASTSVDSKKELPNNDRSFTALATLHMFSGSGNMKFAYYNKDRVNWSNYPWFWANVSDEQAKYISENKDSVFGVEGVRNNADCGYIGDGSCLEDVNVTKITALPNFRNGNMPKFEDFPALIKSFTGSPAVPDFKTNSNAREYRTAITNGMQAGAGFAGEYTVVSYGCGTSCVLHTIVNTRTGKIVSYNEILSSCGISYHSNSRLLVVNPPEEVYSAFGNDIPENYCPTEYYYLSKDGTKMIKLPKD